MLTLIIDTSTEKSFVILAKGSEVIHFKILGPRNLSSKSLLSSIQALLNEADKKAGDIELVGVGLGPGAFTGIRIGVATAKGMVFHKGLPLIGFSTLSAFTSPHDGPFVSAIDAKMGDIYILFQERKGDEIIIKGEPQLLPVDALEGQYVVGPSFDHLPIKRALSVEPDLSHIAHLVSQKKSATRLELLYLRNPYERA